MSFRFDFALPEAPPPAARAGADKEFRFDFLAPPAPAEPTPPPSVPCDARELLLDNGARIEADFHTSEVHVGAGVELFRIVDTEGLTLKELADTNLAPADVIPGVYEGGLKVPRSARV